jgi:hypothetical protein
VYSTLRSSEMALSLSMGSLRIAHWQSAPGAEALRASAPRGATARVSLSVQAEVSSRDRRIRRHQSLRKKVRVQAAARHASGEPRPARR